MNHKVSVNAIISSFLVNNSKLLNMLCQKLSQSHLPLILINLRLPPVRPNLPRVQDHPRLTTLTTQVECLISKSPSAKKLHLSRSLWKRPNQPCHAALTLTNKLSNQLNGNLKCAPSFANSGLLVSHARTAKKNKAAALLTENTSSSQSKAWTSSIWPQFARTS